MGSGVGRIDRCHNRAEISWLDDFDWGSADHWVTQLPTSQTLKRVIARTSKTATDDLAQRDELKANVLWGGAVEQFVRG